jgi:hypothetical protein
VGKQRQLERAKRLATSSRSNSQAEWMRWREQFPRDQLDYAWRTWKHQQLWMGRRDAYLRLAEEVTSPTEAKEKLDLAEACQMHIDEANVILVGLRLSR